MTPDTEPEAEVEERRRGTNLLQVYLQFFKHAHIKSIYITVQRYAVVLSC